MRAPDISGYDSSELQTVGGLARRYLSERSNRGELSANSVKGYRKNLHSFVQHVGFARPARQINRRHVERWLETQGGRVAPATLRVRLSAVKVFLDWAVEHKHIPRNPAAGIRPPRQPRAVPRALKPAQVAAALRHAADRRERLAILLMVQEGLRAVEVSRLQLGDIDVEEKVMRVVGKGGHERVLPISDQTVFAICEYVAETGDVSGPLIRSKRDPAAGISAEHASRLVALCMRRAGVPATGHAFRHTAATDMLRHGANIRNVQTALGHVSLATTQRYLSWVVGDLRKEMGGREYGDTAVRRDGRGNHRTGS